VNRMSAWLHSSTHLSTRHRSYMPGLLLGLVALGVDVVFESIHALALGFARIALCTRGTFEV
jgi:hypothetical protein